LILDARLRGHDMILKRVAQSPEAPDNLFNNWANAIRPYAKQWNILDARLRGHDMITKYVTYPPSRA
jgi:hypothetical protein